RMHIDHGQDERSDVQSAYSSDGPCGHHAAIYGFARFARMHIDHGQDERSDVQSAYSSDGPCGHHAAGWRRPCSQRTTPSLRSLNTSARPESDDEGEDEAEAAGEGQPAQYTWLA